MRLEPIGDYVLIKKDETKTMSEGGLEIPETAQEEESTGVVVEVGPGLLEDGQRASMQCEVGNHVLIHTYAGSPVTLDDVEYIIVRETDILGILREDIV